MQIKKGDIYMVRCLKEKMITKNGSKLYILVSLMVLAMCFGMGKVNTYATEHNVNDCVTKITNPTYHNAEGGYSEYNYVYFGKTDESDVLYDQINTPILYRVLNTKANNRSADPDDDVDALLMLTEYDIFKGSRILDDYPYGENWEDGCDINLMLNSDDAEGGTLRDCFTQIERNAILQTYNTEITQNKDEDIINGITDKIEWNDNQTVAYGSGLTGDRLFILSALEATNKNYGFADIENDHSNLNSWQYRDLNRVLKRASDFANSPYIYWWLRSSSNVDKCGTCITDSGLAAYMHINSACGVRFALNIPMTNIIYTSAASNSNQSVELSAMPTIAPSARAICATGTVPVTEFASKLTIKDSSRDLFRVTESSVESESEGTVTLNYEYARTNAIEDSKNEFISVIIKDENGEGLYYGTLKQNTTSQDASGEVTLTLPELDDGNYTLVILNEQRNPACETNYAGYDTVALSVGENSSSETTKRKAMVKATDEGTGLWKVVATPSEDAEALAYFDENGGLTQTIIFEVDDDEITDDRVYIVDNAGNVSTPLPLITDEVAPTGQISYNGGEITLTVSDDKSGIAKIGDVEYSTYPTQTAVPIQSGTISMEVEDALGNMDVLALNLDDSEPEGSNGFKKIDSSGETPILRAIISVSKTGASELWKVVPYGENPEAATPLTINFIGNGANRKALFQTTNTNIEYVYVLDHAGNVSTPIPLVVDTEAPTAVIDKTSVPNTVTITDSGAGIVRIGNDNTIAYSDEEIVEITNEMETLEVEDALGNVRLIVVQDNDGPEVSIKYARTPNDGKTYITLTATDIGSGLAEVLDSDGQNPTTLYTFTDTAATQTVRFTVNSVINQIYLKDKDGNISGPHTLEIDNGVPVAERGYIKTIVL